MNASVSVKLLEELQAQQLQHDLLAHTSVLQWPTLRRLTHFALHFAKYQGTLVAGGLTTSNRAKLLADTFIICLAAANTLNGSLRVDTRRARPSSASSEAVLLDYVVSTGRFAKACEALDHAEAYPVEAELRNSLSQIADATVQLCTLLGIDLEAEVRTRWVQVEAAVQRRLTRSEDRAVTLNAVA
jgi:hypothetical protein